MPDNPKTCSTCQHWLLQDTGRMNDHGMHPCAFGRVWTYLPAQHTCQRWAKRSAAAASSQQQKGGA